MKVVPKKNAILELMFRQTLSQKNVQELSGLSITTVNRICNGKLVRSPVTAKKFAKALKCTFDDIFEFMYDEVSHETTTA